MTTLQDMQAQLAAFQQYLSLEVAPKTLEAYLQDVAKLGNFAGETSFPALTSAQLRQFLAEERRRGLSGRSLARMLSAWRRFFHFLRITLGNDNLDPCHGLRTPKWPRYLPDTLTPDEACRLVEIPVTDALSARDRAMCELLYSSGLRVAELMALAPEDLDFADAMVKIHGKGGRSRVVPIGGPALAALRHWITVRAALDPPADPAALFVAMGGRRLTARAVQVRLPLLARKQGLSRRVYPHLFRHSFASHLLQESGDLRAIQELLGHASIASTQIYTQLNVRHLVGSYQQAHPRAKRRVVPMSPQST